MSNVDSSNGQFKFSLLNFDAGLMEGVLENPRKTVGMVHDETVPAFYTPLVSHKLEPNDSLTLHPPESAPLPVSHRLHFRSLVLHGEAVGPQAQDPPP